MVTIYDAGNLFTAPDQFYNLLLGNRIERLGHKVIIPQRDGFEFSKLTKSLDGILASEEIPNAVNRIIYLLDKGKFIGQDSDVCIARLDEPLDGGVDNEIDFCKMKGIPVIGYRTDVRSPYGNYNNESGGMHFFPAYTCDKFILIPPNFKTMMDADEHFSKLANEINESIPELISKYKQMNKEYGRHDTPLFYNQIVTKSGYLFLDIKDIHSEEGLFEIANRYVERKSEIEKILPEVKRL
jgi:hypothetical protein